MRSRRSRRRSRVGAGARLGAGGAGGRRRRRDEQLGPAPATHNQGACACGQAREAQACPRRWMPPAAGMAAPAPPLSHRHAAMQRSAHHRMHPSARPAHPLLGHCMRCCYMLPLLVCAACLQGLASWSAHGQSPRARGTPSTTRRAYSSCCPALLSGARAPATRGSATPRALAGLPARSTTRADGRRPGGAWRVCLRVCVCVERLLVRVMLRHVAVQPRGAVGCCVGLLFVRRFFGWLCGRLGPSRHQAVPAAPQCHL